MNKKNPPLSELIKKFTKNDVIAEIEKEYSHHLSSSIPLNLIDDNHYLKKVKLNKEMIDRFISSVKEKGIFNPLVIRNKGTHYELVLGRKRYLAAKLLALKTVNTIIVNISNEEMLLMLLADIRDQKDGNIVEMANVYNALKNEYSYSIQTLAKISHFSRCQVANTIRILELNDNILNEVSQGYLSYGHVRCLIGLSNQQADETVKKIHEEKLSVRQLEDYVRNLKNQESNEVPIEKVLKERLKAKNVYIHLFKLEIEFNNEEEKKLIEEYLLKYGQE